MYFHNFGQVKRKSNEKWNVATLKTNGSERCGMNLSKRKSVKVNLLSRLQLVVVLHLHSCYIQHNKMYLF